MHRVEDENIRHLDSQKTGHAAFRSQSLSLEDCMAAHRHTQKTGRPVLICSKTTNEILKAHFHW